MLFDSFESAMALIPGRQCIVNMVGLWRCQSSDGPLVEVTVRTQENGLLLLSRDLKSGVHVCAVGDGAHYKKVVMQVALT